MTSGLSSLISLGRSPRFRAARSPALDLLLESPRGQTVSQALAGASAYLKKHPRSAWALALRGDLKRFPEIGDFPGAVADFQAALRLAPREAWIHAYLSRALISIGDPQGALGAVRRAVALRPDCGWIRAWEGEVLRRKGSAREAVRSLDRAIKIDGSYEFAWAWRGGANRLLGRLKEAERDLTRAIALDPSYAWSFVERQLVRRACGRINEALDDLEAARRLDPKSEFCARPDEAPRAIAQLSSWLAKHPKDVDLLVSAGNDARSLARVEQAIALYEAALLIFSVFSLWVSLNFFPEGM